MPNSLINETSPYLLQYAHNPVDWHAWNEETLTKARSQNKMLLISIGYAACHWCHVMEHESFEREEVAKVMNENYICIKIDREERPDVDQVYRDAAYLINGNGGWPLNALAMPNGKPFFAGTYFPKENWIRLLEYFAAMYKNERSKLEEQSENILKGIQSMETIPLNKMEATFHKNDLDEMFSDFEKRIDWERGGTIGRMKFAMPSIWEFLLNYHYFSGNKKAIQAVETTLHNMALGGIYDHVGGGFARYSTDNQWHVPHFEKMLYDNAQLVSLYSHAFQVTEDPLYKKIVFETLAFVSRELTSPEGGFYSSLDADSEGEEGKFYVWSEKEIKQILGYDASEYLRHYHITSFGNWEDGKNIPDINYERDTATINFPLPETGREQRLSAFKQTLLSEREKRIRPATDDKILTSWNALMAIGFIDAYQAFGEKSFYDSAKRNIDFLLKNICESDGSLYRNYKNGKASIHAFLDDYSFMISALIHFYQISFEESYLYKAKEITEYVKLHFFDNSTGMFFYTNDQYSHLIARKKEITDNVIPSSNSEMAKNLFLLGLYFEDDQYKYLSLQQIKNVMEDTKKILNYYSNWAIAATLHIYPPFEIAITGNEWKEKLTGLQKEYISNALFLGGKEGTLPLLEDKIVPGKTMIYVCRNKTCQLPVTEVKDTYEQMANRGLSKS
ncbi:MAG: thioredoxin domain-containing protein [Ginsengibacter sp.]